MNVETAILHDPTDYKVYLDQPEVRKKENTWCLK